MNELKDGFYLYEYSYDNGKNWYKIVGYLQNSQPASVPGDERVITWPPAPKIRNAVALVEDDRTERERHLCDVLLAKMRNKRVEIRVDGDALWQESTRDDLFIGDDVEYRIVEETPLDIPWRVIAPEYEWAFVDGNIVYLSTVAPTHDGLNWCVLANTRAPIDLPIPDGVVPKLSLTRRPTEDQCNE